MVSNHGSHYHFCGMKSPWLPVTKWVQGEHIHAADLIVAQGFQGATRVQSPVGCTTWFAPIQGPTDVANPTENQLLDHCQPPGPHTFFQPFSIRQTTISIKPVSRMVHQCGAGISASEEYSSSVESNQDRTITGTKNC